MEWKYGWMYVLQTTIAWDLEYILQHLRKEIMGKKESGTREMG